MSGIEWTGETWNPIIGCSIVSPGCSSCYAMKMAARIEAMGHSRYEGLTKPSKAGPVWTGKVRLVEEALSKPLKRKRPTTYFVNSMSDLFHEDVPDEWIDRIFAVMSLCPQHTFQVLTKRSARMRAYFAAETVPDYSAEMAADDEDIDMGARRFALTLQLCKEWNIGRTWSPPRLPLDNVWLGVSCEDQRRADERIPDLLATPAAVRFVSAEPLLGPIDFTTNRLWNSRCSVCAGPDGGPCVAGPVGINWVIVGGESGASAREFKLNWARDIVRQCKEADVAVFVKQLGAHASDMHNGLEFPVGLRNRKGGDMSEWPTELCIREMPQGALA